MSERFDGPDLGVIMSNYDHHIEPWAEERLVEGSMGGTHGMYTGWNFCARVAYCAGRGDFVARVMKYGTFRENIYAKTLRELMVAVCNEYGSE